MKIAWNEIYYYLKAKKQMKENKILIYQVLPRLFGNQNTTNKENGTLEENGVGKLSAFDNKALTEIKKMGFTHIWYTGLLEHATKSDFSAYGIANDHHDVVKGNAGSPYAIKDYYDIAPALADQVDKRIEEFEALVERTHKNGLKLIMDFVPNHVARQYHSDAKPKRVKDFGETDGKTKAFDPNNNFYYIPGQKLELQFDVQQTGNVYLEYPAKATGNDNFSTRPSINDWYETVKLNYGVDYMRGRSKHFSPIPNLWHKMYDILIYWAKKGVDAFRCDMAEMVPVEFWQWVIPAVKKKYKSILFIAEIYKPDEYAMYVDAGFDYLYDKVGLYDTLRDITCGYRPSSDITFCWQKLNGLDKKMLNFLENHDEQRIASDFFAGNVSKAIPAMIVSATMNTNPLMIYFGQELGERGMDKEGFSGKDGRTTIFDYWSVKSIHDWRNEGKFGTSQLSEDQISLRKFYIKLLQICNEEEAIQEGVFYDLMYANYENDEFDSTKLFAFVRATKKEMLFIIVNFADYDIQTSTRMPKEMFDFLQIDPKQAKIVKELLSNKKIKLDSQWPDSLKTDINARSGKIIKFSLS